MPNAQILMTPNPRVGLPQTPVSAIAKMMQEENCGLIPIVDNEDNRKLLGVVTDRDIVVRLVAQGQEPAEATAEQCMTTGVNYLTEEANAEEITGMMEMQQIRRVPIVGGTEMKLVGIVSLADIARASDEHGQSAIEEISKPADDDDAASGGSTQPGSYSI